MNRIRGLGAFLCVLVLITSSQNALAEEAEEAEEAARPRRTEFVIDGVMTAVWLAMLPAEFIETNTDATIGPSFRGPEDIGNLETALAEGRFQARNHDNDTVPDEMLTIMLVSISLGSMAIAYGIAPFIDSEDQNGRWFLEQLLSATLGMFHAMFGTTMLTEVAKTTSGRLRPDFVDRADRYYCYLDDIPAPYQARCSSLEASGELGPQIDESRNLESGRRSFWSGHASMIFATATYASLLIGGRMVWGQSATPLTRALGLLVQGASMATAAYVAASRVSDGAHHLEDVLVGSAVGIGMACFGYFLHFGLSGEVRPGLSFSVNPAREGVALTAVGRF